MGIDKAKGYRNEKEDFLVYLEDNNQQVSAYVHIIEIKDGLITFQTNKNMITLPIARIIKIKKRAE